MKADFHFLHSLTQIGNRNGAESRFDRIYSVPVVNQVMSADIIEPVKYEPNVNTIVANWLLIFDRICYQSVYRGQFIYWDSYIIFIHMSVS